LEQTDDSQTPRWPNSHPARSGSYTTIRAVTWRLHTAFEQNGNTVTIYER
jgi:hypothetical protein